MQIDWGTKVIYVYKADDFMTDLGGNLYEMDTNAFRLALKNAEDDEEGIPHDDTHSHNTQVLLGGVIYARVIEMINGYTITFEDGQYAVNLKGSNNNIADVTNVNQVSLRVFNSAGLQVVETGITGLTDEEAENLAIAAGQATFAHLAATTAAEEAEISRKLSTNKAVISPDDLLVTVYDDDGTTVLYQFDISSDKRVRIPR